MTEDKFEKRLINLIAELDSLDGNLGLSNIGEAQRSIYKEELKTYRAFKSEKPQPTEDEFDIAIETEQNKVINPGMLDMAVSDNDNYKLGFIHGLQKSKYVYRSLATKPTATASLSQAVVDFGKWLIDLSHDYPGQRVDISLIQVKFTDMVGEFEHAPVPSEKPAKDLQGQHAQMVALAKAHGLDIAADWAVNMSGKTFSEEKPTPSSDEQGLRESKYELLDIASDMAASLELHNPNDPVLERYEAWNKDKYLSFRHPAAPSQEPLEELANRKNCWVASIFTRDVGKYSVWDVVIRGHFITARTFEDKELIGAKKLARAYLEGLPDVDKEGR